MINKEKSQKGYTMIELLVVLSILAILSGLIGAILYSSLRGGGKTKITTAVSQNGDYALSVIRSIISDSRSITAINGTTIDDCTAAPSSDTVPTPTPQGTKPSITFRRIDGGLSTITCSSDSISSGSASLVNSSEVKVSSCSFSCTQLVTDPYSIPVVNISFIVSDKNANFFENRSQATFNISTSLRTYSP